MNFSFAVCVCVSERVFECVAVAATAAPANINNEAKQLHSGRDLFALFLSVCLSHYYLLIGFRLLFCIEIVDLPWKC